METTTMSLAEAYYTLVGQKNVEGIKKYLHANAELHGPMARLEGSEAIMKATSNFMNTFNSLTIRSKFGSKDQAMIVYDVDIRGIDKKFPGASLLSFQDGLIIKIELFYDSSRIVEKKEEIFSENL